MANSRGQVPANAAVGPECRRRLAILVVVFVVFVVTTHVVVHAPAEVLVEGGWRKSLSYP